MDISLEIGGSPAPLFHSFLEPRLGGEKEKLTSVSPTTGIRTLYVAIYICVCVYVLETH